MLVYLRESKLYYNIKKSKFVVIKTRFLKFIITTLGVRKDPAKTIAIRDWLEPTTLNIL